MPTPLGDLQGSDIRVGVGHLSLPFGIVRIDFD